VTYGGDSGNRIFVLYWRFSLIRVSVIRGSTVFKFNGLSWIPDVILFVSGRKGVHRKAPNRYKTKSRNLYMKWHVCIPLAALQPLLQYLTSQRIRNNIKYEIFIDINRR
jgi:hypothetical protein